MSSGKNITFEVIALSIGKKTPKPSGELKKKTYVQLVKKVPKLIEKIKRKTGDLIDKKSSNSIKKRGEKPIICTVLCRE